MMSSLRHDWATPRTLFEALNREFHFELDVCATRQTTMTPYWLETGALEPDVCWTPSPAWMNPPFRNIASWIEKAAREARLGTTVVCLLPSRTDTRWWHDYVLPFGEIRFLRGRLNFDDQSPRGRAPFPSVIVVFRPDAFTREEESR